MSIHFNLYSFELVYNHFPTKRGLLLEGDHGRWAEVSPLEGRSRETLEQAKAQLNAVKKGWKGPLYPSVAFGLYALQAVLPAASVECALLLHGSPKDALSKAQRHPEFNIAKVKLGTWNLDEAVTALRCLSSAFKLRIDFNHQWSSENVLRLCEHLDPSHVDFIEDAGCYIPSFICLNDEKDESTYQQQVWKPMIKGLPLPHTRVILSSSFESSIGLASIASLIHTKDLFPHVAGLGTLHYLKEDLVENPAYFDKNRLHFPSYWHVKKGKLKAC